MVTLFHQLFSVTLPCNSGKVFCVDALITSLRPWVYSIEVNGNELRFKGEPDPRQLISDFRNPLIGCSVGSILYEENESRYVFHVKMAGHISPYGCYCFL